MDIEIIKEIMKHPKQDKLLKYFVQKKLIVKEELLQAILNSKDAYLMYLLALSDIKDISIKQLEQLLCKTNEAEYIFYFARDVKGADISFLTKEICKTKNAEYIYKFATIIKEANIFELETAIFQTENLQYIILFIKNVFQKSSDKLEDAFILLASKNPISAQYIYQYAKEIPEANIEKLEEAICKTKNAEYIYKFAFDIKLRNLSKLEEAICRTQNAKYIYEFANRIQSKYSDMSKLEDAICKTDDAEYIYKFAQYIVKANISKLEDAIVRINNQEYVFRFIQIKGANIMRLQEEIIKGKNAIYIYHLALYFDNCSMDEMFLSKLEDAIIQTKDYKVIMDFIKNIKNCCLSKFEKVIMESNNTHYIKEYNHLRFLSAKSFSEELNTYTPRQKLDLLNDWIKNDQFLLINCYAEYILLGTENEEIGKCCDKLYELKMKSIGATANILRLRKGK